jgi:hypothetical protein
MFKKIELWVLCLVVLLGIVFTIGFGTLVRQELIGKKGKGEITQAALFLAEIPIYVKKIYVKKIAAPEKHFHTEDRFPRLSGFVGKPLEQEEYLLLSRYDPEIEDGVIDLVDLRTFETVYSWNPSLENIRDAIDSHHVEFFVREKKHRIYDKTSQPGHPFLFEDGSLSFSGTGPLVKISRCSDASWILQEDLFHHSVEQAIDGSMWVPSKIYPHSFDVALVGSAPDSFSDDAITQISADGKILFQKSVAQILIDHGYKHLVFSIGETFEFVTDPIHLNDIQPVDFDGPYWLKGDVFLSLRNQSMLMLYRPKRDEIVWLSTGHTSGQHDIDILDDHRISVFDNNVYKTVGGHKVDGTNLLKIYNFETNTFSNYQSEVFEKNDIRTGTEGRAQIRGDGGLYIEETNHGRTMYFTAGGEIQWQYVNRGEDGHVYQTHWSRLLYKPADIATVDKLLSKEPCLEE